ncbi:MAG TPA: hypothetical protein VFL91_13785 [Thermomicrobiales bacterium]|nr:hypothetical protein [Thermomicrobiales bacterium]
MSRETIRAIVRRVGAEAAAAALVAGEGLVAAHAMARAASTGGAEPALARPSGPRPGRTQRALGLAARR